MLLEEDIILLNELRQNNPSAYARKLKILGISDEDVPRRQVGGVSEKRVAFKEGHVTSKDVRVTYFMGGKPYYGKPPAGSLPKNTITSDRSLSSNQECSKKEIAHVQNHEGILYLVDGDNHIYEALSGIKSIGKKDSVQVYMTQDGLSKKLDRKYGDKIKVKEIRQGNQAVDNVIKSILGNEAVQSKYSEVVVLSHDKGYRDQIKKANRTENKKFRQSVSIKQAIINGKSKKTK